MDDVIASIIWRRIDTPGHDACRFGKSDSGWRIAGDAVFVHEGVPAHLTYFVRCDLGWRTLKGQVHGWLGLRSVDFSVTRTSDGVWAINGAGVSELGDCIDLDFGFTPATNLIQIRRLALAQGQVMDTSASWLDVSLGTLKVLNQRYERRSESTYWYEAPRFNYSAMLEVEPTGFIQRYPGLWEAEVHQSRKT